ncbi:MAG: hypothetical protein L3K05_02845 [Thermoplasmata archaeon]|nr:hypothetical protein [Thermoplasmata archaeon]
MSKRRVSAAADDAAPERSRSPEERRKQRKKDRAARKAGRTSTTSNWRRAAYIGVPAAVVVAVAVVLITLTNANSIPCLQLTAVPVGSSGSPAFPPHNTSSFANTWCPGGVTTAMATFPLLTITISGTSVPLPNSIGRNTSYPGGVECDLPVLTRAPTSGYPAGTVYVQSPWAFNYNLSTFFSIWSQSYANVFVNSSHASQPIVYQPNDLLGFSADSTHAVRQFVDGSPSTAGPTLGIVTLDYGPNPYPTCLGEKYGTGHRILLTYGGATAGAAGARVIAPTLASGPADPGANLLLYDSPMPHLGFGAAERTAFAKVQLGSLAWLVGRHAA